MLFNLNTRLVSQNNDPVRSSGSGANPSNTRGNAQVSAQFLQPFSALDVYVDYKHWYICILHQPPSVRIHERQAYDGHLGHIHPRGIRDRLEELIPHQGELCLREGQGDINPNRLLVRAHVPRVAQAVQL